MKTLLLILILIAGIPLALASEPGPMVTVTDASGAKVCSIKSDGTPDVKPGSETTCILLLAKRLIAAKQTAEYWHTAFDAALAAQAKERADAASKAAADAIKASCAGEIKPEGREFVCVAKPEAAK